MNKIAAYISAIAILYLAAYGADWIVGTIVELGAQH